jgi:hypothetical protein
MWSIILADVPSKVYLKNGLKLPSWYGVQIKTKDAKSITLAPTEPLKILGAEEYLATLLVDQIITKGDIIPIGIMGHRLDLMVVRTNPPKGSLKITDSTNNRI